MSRRIFSPGHTSACGFLSGRLPDNLYTYADTSPPHRRTRPSPAATRMTVMDDWPEYIRVTEAEIAVFEAWFGDILEELIQGE